jgi:hypothetical protein
MSNSYVNVWVGTKRKEAMVIPTDKDGIARLRLTDNDCGKATASPKPGELIIFVRPLTWWEKLKQ